MIFTKTELDGLFVIEPEKHEDLRGYFLRTYCAEEFRAHGLDAEVSQCSLSYNVNAWTIRGLHYQTSPYEEVKVVRCLKGAIFDVAVDVRRDSPTRGRYISLELSGDNCLAFYIPKGFAHGFMSLCDDSLVLYQMSAPYHQESARTIRWNDPDINIAWPKYNCGRGGGHSLSLTKINSPPLCAMFKARVLVTGATGLIGQYAVPIFIEAGYEVFGASRSGKGAGGVSLDLHDHKAVSSFMESLRPEYLLHLAWDVTPGYVSSPNNLDWVISSLHLLKCFALNGGRRAVFAGTLSEYDLYYGFLTEDITPLKPESLYEISKVSLSQIASEWAESQKVSFAWGRVFFLYGKGEKPERIVPYIVNSLKNGEKPKLKYPHILRDYMHASDMARGLTALTLHDFCGAVNIASGEAVRLCDIAKKAAEVIGCPVPEYEMTGRDDIAPLVLADTRRLNDVIGFTPKVSWEEGLRDLL